MFKYFPKSLSIRSQQSRTRSYGTTRLVGQSSAQYFFLEKSSFSAYLKEKRKKETIAIHRTKIIPSLEEEQSISRHEYNERKAVKHDG